MLDILIDAISWEDVGEWALKGLAAIGIGVAAAGTAEAISRLATGKGVFDHIRNFSAGIEDRLKKWMKRQQVDDVVIKRFVFVFETFNTALTKTQDVCNTIEKAFVKVSIYGQTSSGRKVNTGEEVIVSVTKSEAKELTDKHEMLATLDELGL